MTNLSLKDNRIVIVGGGGHALCVIDALRSCSVEIFGIVDPSAINGGNLLGVNILGTDELLPKISSSCSQAVIGLGVSKGLRYRRLLHQTISQTGLNVVGFVDSRSTVSSSVTLSKSAQIMAGAILNPNSVVCESGVVNTGSVIEHGARIGAYSFVGPGAIICGDVNIESEVLVGAGAVISPGIAIGRNAIIGAGAVVVRNVRKGDVVVGNPAKVIGCNLK